MALINYKVKKDSCNVQNSNEGSWCGGTFKYSDIGRIFYDAFASINN